MIVLRRHLRRLLSVAGWFLRLRGRACELHSRQLRAPSRAVVYKPVRVAAAVRRSPVAHSRYLPLPFLSLSLSLSLSLKDASSLFQKQRGVKGVTKKEFHTRKPKKRKLKKKRSSLSLSLSRVSARAAEAMSACLSIASVVAPIATTRLPSPSPLSSSSS